MRIESENNNVSFEPNFAEGFRRLMSAMFAHSSKLVKSSTLSHFLLLYKQRFRFSHDSTTIPTQHLLDWYDGDKELYFRLRKISKDEDGNICHIPEYYINNYIYRHIDLQDYSLYELAIHFEIKERTSALERENESGCSSSVFQFFAEHPSSQYTYLVKRKFIAVPKICNTKLFPNVKELKVNSYETDEHTKWLREEYAKLALLLFYPFQNKSDLTINESFWKKYQTVMASSGFSPTSLSVMQNIQDVNYNCVSDGQMLLDPTLHDTVLNRTNEDKQFMKSLQSEKDDDYASFEELQKAFDSLGPDTGYEPEKNVRRMRNLIERHDISSHPNIC